MDLFGPNKVLSLGGKKYCMVIVDDFSGFTWVIFLAHKSDTFAAFAKFSKRIHNEKGFMISCIKTDHGGEFENQDFSSFCDDAGITFSTLYTPQQNGVVERKNRSLQEMG